MFLLAHLLHGIGRRDEALIESRRAREMQPDNPRLVSSNGIMLYWARDHLAARAAFQRGIELDSSYALARFWMALNEVSLGNLDGAMESALAARERMGNAPTCAVGYVHAMAGRRAEALEVLRAMEAHATRAYVSPMEFAIVHVGLGQHDVALDLLERAREEHARWIELIAVFPVMDPLRDHPRFKKILRAMNLPGGS